MAFRGLSPRRAASAAKPPGELGWFAVPTEPQVVDVPEAAAYRAERADRAVELRRSGMTYLAIAETLGIGEATARRAVLGLDRTSTPLPSEARKGLPERIKGRDGRVRRAIR